MAELTDREFEGSFDIDRWAEPIGKFVMAMGEIEHGVNLLCKRFAPLPVAKLLAEKFRLGPRIEALSELVKESTARDAGEVLSVLDRARRLLVHRNLIAHNAPAAQVYFDENDQIADMALKIVDSKGREVDIDRLLELVKEAEGVAMDVSHPTLFRKPVA